MDEHDDIWRRAGKAENFLEVVRGGIPLAAEQIDVLVRIVRAALGDVRKFLDIGCGDGILSRAILAEYPDAHGLLLDYSPDMIESARRNTSSESGSVRFVVGDFSSPAWVDAARDHRPLDLVVSGFAIHHQPDPRKQRLYEEVFELLEPGGLFLNLEHVASKSAIGTRAFEELFLDSLWSFHRKRGGTKSRDELAEQQAAQDDAEANLLAPVERQCAWLGAAGFVEVDCFFKVLELALFGGRKPRA